MKTSTTITDRLLTALQSHSITKSTLEVTRCNGYQEPTRHFDRIMLAEGRKTISELMKQATPKEQESAWRTFKNG